MTKLKDLPEILAGPIVRRASPDLVYVWIATSIPLTNARVRLYDIEQGDSIMEFPSSCINHTDVELGDNLFVILFEVEPLDPLPLQQLIGYDIRESDNEDLEDPDREEWGLADYDNYDQIVLPGLPMPTFFFPPPNARKHRFLYGSCRKLHGPGEDLIQAGTKVLFKDGHNPKKRPATLFLGGDQIYADDVSYGLTDYIRDLGIKLIGRKETFEKSEGNFVTVDDVKRGKRKKYLGKHAEFTSGHADNHLMAFGEFAATYLLAWNPNMWLISLPNSTPDYKADADIKRGLEGAIHARMLLANIVTYMCFDDHEVTDDWNLTPKWTEKVMKTTLGPQILANGLAAYWAFQGLGNNPSDFNLKFAETVEWYTSTGKGRSKFQKKVLEFDDWSYITPTWPRALVLNTRTERGELQPLNFLGRPKLEILPEHRRRLFGENEVYRLSKLLLAKAGIKKGDPLIVLAPGPVLDMRAKDIAQSIDRTASGTDAETFPVNPKSTIDLVKVVQPYEPSPLIILTGDVHAGAEASVKLLINKDTSAGTKKPPQRINMVQLCSSALKNYSQGGIAKAAGLLNQYYKSRGHHKRTKQDSTVFFWMPDDLKVTVGTHPYNPFDPYNGIRDKERKYLMFSMTYRFEVHSQWEKENELAPWLHRNNMGDFWVKGNTVEHRFHYSLRLGHYDTTPYRTWDSNGTWPVKEY